MMDWFSRHNMFSVKLIPVSPISGRPTIAGEDHAALFDTRYCSRHSRCRIRSAKRYECDSDVWHMELRQFACHDAGDCGGHRSNDFSIALMARLHQESMGEFPPAPPGEQTGGRQGCPGAA